MLTLRIYYTYKNVHVDLFLKLLCANLKHSTSFKPIQDHGLMKEWERKNGEDEMRDLDKSS